MGKIMKSMLGLCARYPEGGEASYWVLSLLYGDQREHDNYTQYFNNETQEWRPIPKRFTALKFSGEIIDNNGNIVLMP